MLQPSLPGLTLRSNHDGQPAHGAAASPSETPPWLQPLSPHASAVLANPEQMSEVGKRGKPPFACPAQLTALSFGNGGFVE